MQHFWSLEAVHLPNSWLTIGSFDGVHRGHQEIIQRMIAGAHAVGSPAVVLTFYPHPAFVLGKRQGPLYLSTPEEKAALLGNLGVDVVITHPFSTRLAALPAFDFMRMVQKHLGVKSLWVGYDFALGRGREGNVNALQEMGGSLGYTLHVVDPIQANRETISSSQVRKALAEGDVTRAASLLGRPYAISGEVEHGDGRGRKIGTPTANLNVWPARVIPKPGIYVCRASWGGRTWGAVTNVGFRPTFENQPARPQVEAHLFDYDGNMYGRQVNLAFLARLRDEQRFPDVHALVAQIQRDVAQAKGWLAEHGGSS